MTLHEFESLTHPHQIATVLVKGRFIATRQPMANQLVTLYELPGRFLAELTYDPGAKSMAVRQAFGYGNTDWFNDYAGLVQLPDWVPDAR